MKKTIYILLVSVTTLFVSCGDFLEPKSQSEYSPKDISSLNELILGEAIPAAYHKDRFITGILSLLDDDITCNPYMNPGSGTNFYEDTKFLGVKAVYTWQPQYSRDLLERGFNRYDMYSSYYEYIMGCNAALDYLDKVSGTVEEKNYVKAQALSLRGFYYLQLVNIFGMPYNKDKNALGVPIKTISEFENRPMVRNTVQEVYRQIEKDLLEAESIFAELPASKQWERNFRPSLPMTQLILARMYLYMENWDKVAQYSSKVMNDWSFSLLNIESLPPVTSTSGPYYNFKTYESPETIWAFGSTSSDMFLYARHKFISPKQNNTMFKASDDLLNSFSDGDLRKDSYIVKEKVMVNGKNLYRPFGKIALTSANDPSTDNTKFGHAFRVSEAILMYAEAKAVLYKNGNGAAKADAVSALNKLREKRFASAKYAPIPDMDADNLIKFVREERRRELCFEAFRWFDLRRYGMPQIKHEWNDMETSTTPKVYVLEDGDNAYVLPFPHNVIEKNSDLIQNPLAPIRNPQ